MRNFILFSCFLSFLSVCPATAQITPDDIQNIRHSGLRVIDIQTVNNEIPTCDYAEAPEGSMGYTCINQTKVPCRICITQNDQTLYDSGDYEKSVSGATIKINGNTSTLNNNKPYKLKLQTSADLLLRGDDKYSDKKWRLIKDAVTMKTMIGLKLSELMGFDWTPAYTPCNVFLNGDYQGCYLLIESVEQNNNCRINVDTTTGYIVERDAYWWKESHYFTTDYFASSKSYRWTWKYPDEDDVTNEQEDYIIDYINQAEQSINDGTYEQYIDVESFARWILAHDILGTWDSGGSNLYVTKYDNTTDSRLQMPVLWDFDTIFGMDEAEFSRYHDRSNDFYYPDLFNNRNPRFTETYKQLWNDIKPTLFSQLSEFISAYPYSDEGKALQLSREYYTKRWDCELNTVNEDADYAINWLDKHLTSLDPMINQIVNSHFSILNSPNTQKSIYTLSGHKLSSINYKLSTINNSFYIVDGKKYLSR